MQVLHALFAAPFGRELVFKGGTSLAKAYAAVRRFSEDVDITRDIRAMARQRFRHGRLIRGHFRQRSSRRYSASAASIRAIDSRMEGACSGSSHSRSTKNPGTTRDSILAAPTAYSTSSSPSRR